MRTGIRYSFTFRVRETLYGDKNRLVLVKIKMLSEHKIVTRLIGTFSVGEINVKVITSQSMILFYTGDANAVHSNYDVIFYPKVLSNGNHEDVFQIWSH